MQYKLLSFMPSLLIPFTNNDKNNSVLVQMEAIVNDTSNENNFTIIIIGMIIVILILVGAAMFAPKK